MRSSGRQGRALPGELPAARSLGERALGLRRDLAWPHDVIQSLKDLGLAARAQRDLPAARSHLEEAVALSEESGDEPSLAVSLDRLGTVAHAQGRWGEAHELYARSHAILLRTRDHANCAWWLLHQGRLALGRADLPATRGLLRASLELRRRDGHRPGLICLFEAFAAPARREGRPTRVTRLAAARAALRLATGLLGMPSHQADLDTSVRWAREALGERTFTRAWMAGGALSRREAISLAMEDEDAPGDTSGA